MLKSLDEMIGHRVRSTDGDIGKIKDFFFDDHEWMIRYLVVDAGGWIFEPNVLVFPSDIKEPAGKNQTINLSLTKREIDKSPNVYSDPPVSHQYQAELAKQQGSTAHEIHIGFANGISSSEKKDSNLRSVREVMGYRIKCEDHRVGRVEDFVVDTGGWAIRYVVVDTGNWLPGRKVIVDPAWIVSVSWPGRAVAVDLFAEEIENSPEFDPEMPIDRQYETRLYDYYNRSGYWTDGRNF